MELAPPRDNEKGKPICGARKKNCECGHRFTPAEYDLWHCPECNEPRWCARVVARAGKKCPKHGGKSLAGPAHPNFKDGRHMYGAAMPEHLVESVAAFHEHPESLQLLSEISTQRGRAFELLKRIQEHGGGTWQEVSDAWDELQETANNSKATDEQIRRATRHVESIIKKGLAVDYNWRQYDNTTDRIARLVQMQAEREEFKKSNLKESEAMMFIVRLATSVRTAITRHLTEDNLNNLSADELQRRIMADVSDACRAAATGQSVG